MIDAKNAKNAENAKNRNKNRQRLTNPRICKRIRFRKKTEYQ